MMKTSTDESCRNLLVSSLSTTCDILVETITTTTFIINSGKVVLKKQFVCVFKKLLGGTKYIHINLHNYENRSFETTMILQ